MEIGEEEIVQPANILLLIIATLLLIVLSLLVWYLIFLYPSSIIVKPPDTVTPDPPPFPVVLYTLDTDLSHGTLKPGANSPMQFFVGSDPTHGAVNYGPWNDLVTVTETGKTIISAGKPINGARHMVRLVSTKVYDHGLFIISADHIPEGLSTWPAFWLTSSEGTWACNGEIDIIEGVNSMDANSSRNAITLHTNDKPGVKCRQVGVPGISNGGDCTASGPGSKDYFCGCDGKSLCPYLGCGVVSSSTISFGKGFNDAGGGVYACELTSEGSVTVWFFSVVNVPTDIIANMPTPNAWPSTNRVAFNHCPGQFKSMQMILNTTLCGDWASNTYPGGANACNAMAKSGDLSKAYWSIDYIKVFLKKSMT